MTQSPPQQQQARPASTADELDKALGQLATEQRRLLQLLHRQRDAMKVLDAPAIEQVVREQEASRTRLSSIDSRRKALSLALARELKLPLQPGQEPTLRALASSITDSSARKRLTDRRDELRALAEELAAASHVAGRIAGAVLGHVNSALRLLASAMSDAGTYTRNGAPRCTGGLSALELVG